MASTMAVQLLVASAVFAVAVTALSVLADASFLGAFSGGCGFAGLAAVGVRAIEAKRGERN